MPEVIVIADDLSGAADTGVAFVKRGYQTLVIWDVLSVPPVDVLVFSTESRHIPRDQAVAKVRAAVSQLSNLGDPAFIYKKIDSTLRGHPAAELAVVMNGFDIAKALVAPAFPAQKRVTVSGIHYIDGLPLDQTTFGKEVATANVCELFRDGRARNDVVELGLDIVRMGEFAITQKLRDCTSERIIAVADAETMEDLSALVRAGQAEGFRLYCGSAGLAGALAQTLTCKDTATQLRDFKYKGIGILGVIASRRDNTLRQIAFAKANGIPVVCPDMAWFTNPQASVNPIVRDLQRYLSSDGMALVTAHELPFLPGKFYPLELSINAFFSSS